LLASWLAGALTGAVAEEQTTGDAPVPANLPAPAAQAPMSEYSRTLPFMAQEALDSGHTLPLPFGASLIVLGLDNRKIDVTDVRIGLKNPPQSVSDVVQLGAASNVFNANLKFDAWLLPFLNVYALLGYVHNDSTTHVHVTLQRPGPLPPQQYERDVTTDLSGMVGGLGLTLAGGYGPFFLVFDANYVQSDLGFDDAFKATIATVRAGWNGKLRTLPLQLWLGAGNWDTAATASSTVEIPQLGPLTFQADQRPHTPWMYDLGTAMELSRRVQLLLDVGADFHGGYLFVVGPTYRF
jgi:hypothetical protein